VRLEVEGGEIDTDGTLSFVEAGSLLGELGLLDRLPRSASAYAESAVEARFLSAAAIDELASKHPRIGLALLRALGRDAALKLRQTNERLAEFVLGHGSDPAVDAMVERAAAAQQQIEGWSEERIDALLLALAEAMADQAEELARFAVEETHVGNVEDKVTKIRIAGLDIWRSFAGKPGRGPVRRDETKRVVEIAAPLGVVFGIVPMTNPIATAIFKTMICVKSRNALILSFHHACLRSGSLVGDRIRAVLEGGGAPPDLVQWPRKRGSRKLTARFMTHPGVALILATGGPGLVKAAYSSGKPALGVGAGNTPVLVCRDADLDAVAAGIAGSKSFDNGLICGAEHNLVVEAEAVPELVAACERHGVAVLSPAEAERFAGACIKKGGFDARIVGQSAARIAEAVGIRREGPIRVLVVPAEPDLASPLAGEKMAPVLSLFTVPDVEAGLALCKALLGHAGAGHTAIVHARDPAVVERFGLEVPASRLLANVAGVPGICGLASGLVPSYTLGCGTWGGNSTTDNVTYSNLQNVKRLASYLEPAAG
jgi:acyl-CoA reductase-like NAD-dependent aldehyde dehydrogenase